MRNDTAAKVSSLTPLSCVCGRRRQSIRAFYLCAPRGLGILLSSVGASSARFISWAWRVRRSRSVSAFWPSPFVVQVEMGGKTPSPHCWAQGSSDHALSLFRVLCALGLPSLQVMKTPTPAKQTNKRLNGSYR